MTGIPDIRLTPIGYVHSSRRDLEDDSWDTVKSRIELTDAFGPEAFDGLDAVDGTPVVDIKPVMSEFLPRGAVRQPQWSTELMRHYWRAHD
jgi:tRNA (Thr-GGU) A37 N-methylase